MTDHNIATGLLSLKADIEALIEDAIDLYQEGDLSDSEESIIGAGLDSALREVEDILLDLGTVAVAS